MKDHPLLAAYDEAQYRARFASPAKITFELFREDAQRARDTVVDALNAAPPSQPTGLGEEELCGGYDKREFLALDLRQIADNLDAATGYATADAKIIKTAAAFLDRLPIPTTFQDACARLRAQGSEG